MEITRTKSFPLHGWIGLLLVLVFWPLNWFLPGTRTAWAFFPMWVGYSLTMDALAFHLRGTSLFSRSWQRYIGLFLISIPVWWVFELVNLRVQNWEYLGSESFSPLAFFLLASFNFSVVIPAIFSTAEWFAGMDFIRKIGKGLVIRGDRRTTAAFFVAGVVMLALLLAFPKYFFPFFWLSIFFLLEPLNIWLGFPSLTRFTRRGDWRPIIALWCGVLLTGFFWEMWNYFSYPKWIYTIPYANFLHVFEMPLLGFGGYLPFSLELYALYHLMLGLLGEKQENYLHIEPEDR